MNSSNCITHIMSSYWQSKRFTFTFKSNEWTWSFFFMWKQHKHLAYHHNQPGWSSPLPNIGRQQWRWSEVDSVTERDWLIIFQCNPEHALSLNPCWVNIEDKLLSWRFKSRSPRSHPKWMPKSIHEYKDMHKKESKWRIKCIYWIDASNLVM